MESGLYTGWVRHRRFGPAENAFRYRLWMAYVDLRELPTLFDRYWLWSARRPAIAWFRRADYLGPPDVPLDDAVRDLVEARTGRRPVGPVRMLTHLRYFGWCSNPVSFYYCFDSAGSEIETIVAEITNTPWNERHAYVLQASTAEREGAKVLRFRFEKAFHVSPFMPMDMRYDWRFTAPSEGLDVHMDNLRNDGREFDATLHLRREPITSFTLARALVRFPLMTAKVSLAIYWQALRLLLKGARFHAHPAAVASDASAAQDARH